MNTESFRGLRAEMPTINCWYIASLDEIYEIIDTPDRKEIIKIVGDTLCIE